MVSYIHPNFKLGILLELLCETDFVARNQEFISLAKNLAMHFAANTDLETPRMIQPYVKDPSKTIEELINESVAKLGENIVMGRFTRYELGITPNIGKFENGNY
jgi:elongation factor Ts